MRNKPTDIIGIFSSNLRRIRILKGFSQRELSARCNVDNADISRMENGDINITLKTLEQLANALDVGVLELLSNHHQ